MAKLIRASLVAMALLTGLTVAHAQKIIAGTYNLRYQTNADSGNLWSTRGPMVAALIRFHQFDVFGTQEGLKNQLDDIKKALPDFDYYGAGRDDGKEKGEHSAIFYRKDRFRLLNKGDFWLSETPDQPSMGWDAKCCHRICSWVHLEDSQTGKRFYVFNAHYDHEGQTARIESSKLILQRIQSLSGTSAVVLTGDFNANQQSEAYQGVLQTGLLSDSFRKVNFPYANNGTFNGFGRNVGSAHIIDHIFVTDHFLVSRWGILSDSYLGKYPSDHFPVLAEITLK